MAHAFRIMDSSNVITTYTDYNDIPLATLKHVISFLPDIGIESISFFKSKDNIIGINCLFNK